MMYRLLIVDDERHVVEYLVDLFENQSRYELELRTAYTGMDALHILEQHKVDIIFLDIKMPGMSGLDVFGQILRDWPSCRVVFLTGQSSFEYIYQIEQSQNAFYLLKTEDDDTILQTLKSAIISIEKEKKSHLLANQAEWQKRLVTFLLQREILRDCVNGKDISDLKYQLNRYQNDFPFDIERPVYLCYGKLDWQEQLPHVADLNDQLICLQCHIGQSLNERFWVALWDLNETTVLLFLQPKQSCSRDAIYLKESINDLVAIPSELLKCSILLILLQNPPLWNSVPKAYQTLKYYYDRNPSFALGYGNRGALLSNQDVLHQESEMDDSIKMVSRIQSYMASHIAEDLSLSTISEYVNYNASYVSRVFKHATGQSVSLYTTKLRMAKSIELLQKTNENMQSISEKCGYDSPQYFSLVFKKYTGKTPSEYRNEHLLL